MVDVHAPPPNEADPDDADLVTKPAHLQAPERKVFADEAPPVPAPSA